MSLSTLTPEDALVTQAELLAMPAFRRVPARTFDALRRKGLVPFLLLGHKTYLYRPRAVAEALIRLEKNSLGVPAQ